MLYVLCKCKFDIMVRENVYYHLKNDCGESMADFYALPR